MFARCLWGARFFSQAAFATDAAQALKPPAGVVKHPFFVPRNSNGNLPVYTDIRNGGTRILVSIRNIDGNASVSLLSVVLVLSYTPAPVTRARARVHIVPANIARSATHKNQDEPQPCSDFWRSVEAGGRRMAQGQGLLGLLVSVAFFLNIHVPCARIASHILSLTLD